MRRGVWSVPLISADVPTAKREWDMSNRPIFERLLIKPDSAIWTSDATRLDLVRPLPESARQVDELGQATVALLFAENAASLRRILAEHGLRPISQVALDETWSALRFRPFREGEKPFTGGREA